MDSNETIHRQVIYINASSLKSNLFDSVQTYLLLFSSRLGTSSPNNRESHGLVGEKSVRDCTAAGPHLPRMCRNDQNKSCTQKKRCASHFNSFSASENTVSAPLDREEFQRFPSRFLREDHDSTSTATSSRNRQFSAGLRPRQPPECRKEASPNCIVNILDEKKPEIQFNSEPRRSKRSIHCQAK